MLKVYNFLKLSFFVFPFYIISNPSNPKVIHGEVKFSKEARTLTINQNSHKSIIDWKNFSIDKNEITKIIQPSKSSCSLNRVISKNVSNIFGTLSSNGKVFLINKNGIVIGKSGLIKTQKFIASTLDIANSQFLKDENINFFKNEKGQIENKGTILGEKGVYIFSKRIKNEGKIESTKGDINLIGAEEIFIFKEDENIIIKPKGLGSVDNKGVLKALNIALKASNIDSFAINQEGLIEANTIYEKGGRIFLGAKEGKVNIDGKLTASKDKKGGDIEVIGKEIEIKDKAYLDVSGDLEGGNVNIGKKGFTENLYLSEDSVIKADSIEGDGGQIFLWGDRKNHFYGNISAETVKGNGGFVEISSKKDLLFKGRVSTLSSFGKIGELTLDPVDINITNTSPSNPAFTNPYQPASSPANLYVVDLTNALAFNNVIVKTDGIGGNSNGTISIQTNITWATNTKLTLIADRTIDIAAGIVLSNTFSGANFDAFDFQTTASITGASYDGIVLNNGAQITSIDGDITLLGRGGPLGSGNEGIVLNQGSLITSSGSAKIDLTGVGGGGGGVGTNTNYGIQLDGGPNIANNTVISSTSTGTILLTGSSNGSGNNNYGIYLSANYSMVDSTGTGTITLEGTGGSATSTNDNYGITLDGLNVKVQSVDGDIILYGVSNGTNTNNFGVYMNSSSEVLSTNNAKIIFSDGLGGNPCKGGPGTDYCEGIHINGATITGGVGDVSLKGEGNTSGTGSYNRGINIENGGQIDATASTANISVEGIGGNGVNSNVGVYIYGITSDIVSNTGNITVKGTGRGTGNNNHGVHLVMNSNDKIASNGGGNIDVEGISGTGASSHSVYLEAGNIVSQSTGSIQIKGYGSGSGYAIYNNSQDIDAVNGSVTLIGDTMNLAGGAISGNTDLKVYPNSVSRSIGLAGTGAGLLLPVSALNTFADGFNLITIGDNTNTASITCGAYTFLDSIKFIAGDSITISGNLSAGANNIDFLLGQINPGSLTINAGISITAAAFTATGGANNDTFYIYASGITGTLNGSGGTNTFYGPTSGSTWNITANDAGNITGGPSFTDFLKLMGGLLGDDTYNFSIGGFISSFIDGSGGTGNTIVAPPENTTFTVNGIHSGNINPLSAGATSFFNIEVLNGNSGDNTYNMNGGDMEFINEISGNNIYNINGGTLTSITGGSNDDIFYLNGGTISTINGGVGGVNTLVGPNVVNTWNITGINSGDVGGVSFSHITDLTGNLQPDTFVFSDQKGVAGIVNGIGLDNTLDYSNYTPPVYVDLVGGTATGTGGILNIQNVIYPPEPPVPPIPPSELFRILSTDASLTYKIDYSEYESFYFYYPIYLRFFECYKEGKNCFTPLRYSKLFKIFIK
ncbi:MAG: hypothetical protein AMS24_00210 [Chlamydiae bacterium SM23_39]|nr:MAG: hypothetical protein AMS24_00210 [Chlamydiae bacterium SM23_39]